MTQPRRRKSPDHLPPLDPALEQAIAEAHDAFMDEVSKVGEKVTLSDGSTGYRLSVKDTYAIFDRLGEDEEV